MLLGQAKNRQIENVIREIKHYQRVYPKKTNKIKELRKRLRNLVQC